MSTRDALIQKIQKQPDWLLKEVDQYIDYLATNVKPGPNHKEKAAAWPAGYFEETAGAFANETFKRPAELPFEKREDW